MKSMIQYLSIVFLASTLAACADFESNRSTSIVGSSGADVGTGAIVQSRAVVAVVSRSQVFKNYLSCTGLPETEVSGATRNKRNEVRAAMSEEGKASDIAAGMTKALLDLNAEICNDLIRYEAGLDSRKFFGGFNLNGNRAGQEMDLGRTTRSIASACWGRSATDAEVEMVNDRVSATSLNDDEGSNKALFVCTALLSSSAALKF